MKRSYYPLQQNLLNNIISYPLKCYNRQIAALVCPSTRKVEEKENNWEIIRDLEKVKKRVC